jgi:AAA domain-containing protein
VWRDRTRPRRLSHGRSARGIIPIGEDCDTPNDVPEANFGDPPEPDEPLVDARVKLRADELTGQLLGVDGLRNIPPPAPLVDGYLYLNSLAWLGGKPGHAKTVLAVDLACCVTTGRPWHGHTVTPGDVLYVIAEGTSGLAQRVDAWALANGVHLEEGPSKVYFLPVPVQLMNSLDIAAMADLLAAKRPALVVLDTQARVTVGAEENSSRDMGLFVDSLERLRRESGACILVVHHEPRNSENLRGSTALEGAATTILRTNKDGNVVTVTNSKQKDAPEQPPMTLALTPVASSVILSHEAVGLAGFTTSSEMHVLTVLRDSFGTRGAGKTELRDAVNLAKSTWYRTINDLVNKGLVIERKEGQRTSYTATADNRQTQSPTSPTESQ